MRLEGEVRETFEMAYTQSTMATSSAKAFLETAEY
jgi:hypothetical protein